MRKNSLVICCVTCVFSAFGAFFRWLQNMTAFEAETELYISGNVWGAAIVLLTIILAAAMAVLVLSLKDRQNLTARESFADTMGGSTALYKPFYILLSLVMAAGAFMVLLSAGRDLYPMLQRALAAMGIVGAAGFAVMCASTGHSFDTTMPCVGAAMWVAFHCFWLIVGYREIASSPVIWSYAPEILALVLSLLAAYYTAGFAFGKLRPLTAIYVCQVAAYFCILTLTDERSTGHQLLFIAAAGMALFQSWMMISNLAPRDVLKQERAAADARLQGENDKNDQ